MSVATSQKHILIIDRQHSWLERSVEALRHAGFDVSSLDSYDYSGQLSDGSSPDLVILGCATIGPDELALITRILEHKDQLVVLSTLLPRQTMRTLFLVGAVDVADKPYEPQNLVAIVHHVLDIIAPNDW